MAASQKVANTAQTWYQPKRVPLYLLVGTTVTGAASYLYTRIRNPQVRVFSGEMRLCRCLNCTHRLAVLSRLVNSMKLSGFWSALRLMLITRAVAAIRCSNDLCRRKPIKTLE